MDVNEVFITCADLWAKDGVDDRINMLLISLKSG